MPWKIYLLIFLDGNNSLWRTLSPDEPELGRPEQVRAVPAVATSGVATVIHIGPAPNIIPATIKRLCTGVVSQTSESRSLWALFTAVRRQWLLRLLPQRTALLRAPYIENIVLEDWLLANEPK